MKNQTLIVHLRIFKGKAGMTRLSYDENGNIQNENQIVKLKYGTLEWHNFLKNNRSLKLIDMKAEKVLKKNDGGAYEEIKEIPANIIEEVRIAFHGETNDITLTDEQIRIAELERQIADLVGGNNKVVSTEGQESNTVNSELAEARKDYVAAFGKKGHHSWDAEQIRKKIAEKE